MLILNCSNDAATFFSQKKKGKLESLVEKASSNNPLHDEMDLAREHFSRWFIHAFKFNRKQCLIAMEFETRYAMVFFGLTKSQMHDFPDMLISRFIEGVYDYIEEAELVKLVPKEDLYERFLYLHGETKYFKRSDRSVVSHIKDAIVCYTTDAHYHGLPRDETEVMLYDKKMNETLRSTKQTQKENPGDPYFEPYLKMLGKLLMDYTDIDESIIAQGVDKITSKRRAVFQERFGISDACQINTQQSNVVSLEAFRTKKSGE